MVFVSNKCMFTFSKIYLELFKQILKNFFNLIFFQYIENN